MESSYKRDQTFEQNQKRMLKANAVLTFNMFFDAISGLVLSYVSTLLFLYSFAHITIVGLSEERRAAQYLDKAVGHNVVDFSGWLCVIPLALTTLAMSVVVSGFLKKWGVVVKYIVSFLYAVLGLLVFLGVTDDMPWYLGFSTMAYALIVFWITDHSYRALKEIDFLVTQEGFPLFDLNMHYMAKSHYVKMRKEWEERTKAQDYYGEAERPLVPVVEITEDNAMDGVAVDGDEKTEGWFARNRELSAENREKNNDTDMDMVEGELPENEDFYRMPDRYREL